LSNNPDSSIPTHVQQIKSALTLKNHQTSLINTSLLRRKQVEGLTALSRSRIYALMAAGAFPKPVQLGTMSVAWLETEVREWIASKIFDRSGK
jgi:prophage regulatory protein